MIKQITKLIKSERRIQYKFVKSDVNKTIGRINKTFGHVNESIKSEELQSNNKTTTCEDKYKQNLSAYDIKGEEKTSGTYEKKEKERNGYVCIYKLGKILCTSNFKRTCSAQ